MKTSHSAAIEKLAKWEKPELSQFDIDVSDIQFNFNAGTDGDTGVNTSMS